MNSDSYYSIGHTHDVCQDYALTGKLSNGLMYALIADGCSGSSNFHVDLGARILCHTAVKVLEQFQNKISFSNVQNDEAIYDLISEKIIFYSDFTVRELNLSERSLDSTLTICITDGEHIKIFMYGDGCIIFKNESFARLIQVRYNQNAPNYLSYLLNPEHVKKYNEMNQVKLTYVFQNYNEFQLGYNKMAIAPMSQNCNSRNIFNYKTNDPCFIASVLTCSICSDGIESFFKEFEPIKIEHMIDRFTGFKNYAGEFVKRRMKSMVRECQANKIKHDDDISIATICFNGAK